MSFHEGFGGIFEKCVKKCTSDDFYENLKKVVFARVLEVFLKSLKSENSCHILGSII